MSGRTFVRAAALSAVAAITFTACGDDDAADGPSGSPSPSTPSEEADEPAPPQVFDVSVPGGPDGEFTFATDVATIEAGPVEVRLTNGGALEHQATIFRFPEGEDFGSFVATAAAEGAAAALASVDSFGGPNAVAAGETRSSTQVLEPGDYALVCVIPDANGVPHAAMGMVQQFTVTEPATPPDGAPTLAEADLEVDLVDLAFATPTELDAGAVVEATNRGGQVHEMVAYRLADGQTVQDVVADVEAGTPPSGPAGGLALLHPGRSAQFRLPEEPGDYVFLCFIPDATADGEPPHLTRGMATQVRID